ncbi:hypothetical protein [Streptomyces viridochromogenes]|uniref:hypothetical protein n=1 Tax=Streptomyces viridochromogenes TaxID=1938 RepID=UPI000A87B90A|nr:hypothetical protein [Streptomyces viridochromogenes]
MGISSHPDWDWVQFGSSYTAPHGDLSDDYDYQDLSNLRYSLYVSPEYGSTDGLSQLANAPWSPPEGGDFGVYDHYSVTDADYTFGEPDRDMQVWHQQDHPDTCAIAVQEFALDSVTGQDFSEGALRQEAMEHGWYAPGGGTTLGDVGNLLEAHGIAVEREGGATLQDVAQELDVGHKVIAGVNAETIWDAGHPDGGSLPLEAFPGIPGQLTDHVVEIIGIDQSDPTNPEVVLNDPGTPDGRGLEVPIDVFNQAWAASGNFMVHTDGEEAAAPTGPLVGGYTGEYDGVKNCWYSSDGYVYDSAGNRIGTH